MSSKEVNCHQPAQALEARVDIAGVEPRSASARKAGAATKALTFWWPKPAQRSPAIHTFAQAQVERLIDHAAVFEILAVPLE
jgi:hypothetical protein